MAAVLSFGENIALNYVRTKLHTIYLDQDYGQTAVLSDTTKEQKERLRNTLIYEEENDRFDLRGRERHLVVRQTLQWQVSAWGVRVNKVQTYAQSMIYTAHSFTYSIYMLIIHIPTHKLTQPSHE
jgi:hypothetical protein